MNYATWIRSLVGQEPPYRNWSQNDIAGAVAGSSEFTFLRDRLGERIVRIWKALPSQRTVILEKLANIGTADWVGPFSELVAADFFAAVTPRIELEQVPATPVLGERAGRQRSQLDGYLPSSFGLHYEVKALTEVSSAVLERIRSEVEAKFPHIQVFFSFSLVQGTTDIARFREPIVQAIRAAIASGDPGAVHEESGVRIILRSRPIGVVTTTHHYNPYEQAERRHRQLLDKWHQILDSAPNLRVFVTHPWFNIANADDFGGAHEVFFRTLSRRVFCQLTKDASPLSMAVQNAPPGITIADVAQRISGILFIVDRT